MGGDKHMKKLVTLLLALALIVSATSAFACTGFYVGKKASTSGNVIIGHTVDGSTTGSTNMYTIPRVENEPGRVFTTWDGLDWNLPDTTYAITGTPFNGGTWDGGVANDMGVAISSAVTCYVSDEIAEMDPFDYPGLNEGFMCKLVGLCCATAREGVELLADFIDQYGNAEQNAIMIADQNEAWYMETYTGKQWCAVKMPEDCVAVWGNQFMLGVVDVNSEDVLCSEGLVSMPEAAGLAVYDENGNIDLFATYSGGELGDGSNRRTWYGHKMLAPSTAGEYDTYTKYDLFYQPDELVSLTDVFEVTRARFEGTVWDPDANDRQDQRVIGTEKQCNINAIEIYSDLPAEMACVTWNCFGNSEHTVFLPLSNFVSDVAEAYKYESEEGGYDLNMAWTHYKRLTSLAEMDRELFGRGVREYWASVEAELVETFPTVLQETKALYDTDKAAAQEYITNWTIQNQEETLSECDLIYDELTWYMIKNNIKQKTPYDSHKLAMMDTIPEQEPFVPSLAMPEEEAAAE